MLPAPAANAAVGSNATGVCQGALPVYDTEIRKRPLALRNEGDASAYVSCSLPSNVLANIIAYTYVVNRNAAAVDVDCTFIAGVVVEILPPDYYPLSVSAGPGVATLLEWDAGDYGLPSFRRQ